jgi:hypothetical protein
MRSRWLADLAPPTFAAVAEGAWIAIVAAAVVAPIGGPGPLGSLLPTVAAALIGAIAAQLLPSGGGRAAVLLGVALAVVVGGAYVGQALGVASATGPAPAALYPVLGFAVLRGAAQGDPTAGSHAIDTLVRRSPALLGGAWVLGLVVSGEGRLAFTAAAAGASLAFVLAAALGLGTARLAALPPETREQLRGNNAWLGMVVVVVGCALAVALPLSAVLGQPIGMLAGGVAGIATALILGIAGGLMSVIVFVVDLVAGLIRGLFNITPPPTTQAPTEQTPQQPGITGGSEPTNPVLEGLIGVIVIVGLIALAFYLARRWQGARREAADATDPSEQRSIHLDARPGLPPIRMPRRLRDLLAPHDALDAYQRLLDDWSVTPGLARDPAETPADHARRLRSAGAGAPALDLLAADYQLSRFGGVTLSSAEERRAIGRWRRLRRHRAPS